MQQVSVFAENQRGMMEKITGRIQSVSSRRCSDKSRSSVPSYGSSRRGTDG